MLRNVFQADGQLMSSEEASNLETDGCTKIIQLIAVKTLIECRVEGIDIATERIRYNKAHARNAVMISTELAAAGHIDLTNNESNEMKCGKITLNVRALPYIVTAALGGVGIPANIVVNLLTGNQGEDEDVSIGELHDRAVTCLNYDVQHVGNEKFMGVLVVGYRGSRGLSGILGINRSTANQQKLVFCVSQSQLKDIRESYYPYLNEAKNRISKGLANMSELETLSTKK